MNFFGFGFRTSYIYNVFFSVVISLRLSVREPWFGNETEGLDVNVLLLCLVAEKMQGKKKKLENML